VTRRQPASGAGGPKHVIVVGLPGAGKTSIGRGVARALGRAFIDLDVEVERMSGKSIGEIFAESGESEFRRLEAEVSRIAAERGASVISPGGGWVGNEAATAHLRSTGRIIYLRVSPATAVRRMGQGVSKRPLFANGNPYATMHALYTRRRSLYEQCADLVVDTEGLGRAAVVAKVTELVLAAEAGGTNTDCTT
jgi:shikimate kinase